MSNCCGDERRRKIRSSCCLVCGSDAMSGLILSLVHCPDVISITKKVRVRNGVKLGEPLLSAN